MKKTKETCTRAFLQHLIPILLIPTVIIVGFFLPIPRNHLFVTVAVSLLCVLLLFVSVENKKIRTRRTVIIAIMVALSVAGRWIPLFKPVTALTVLAAMYLGKESGFLVGSFSALLSNFYFGHGPWTPFQMLSWGLIGYVAGIVGKPLQKSRILLCGFGLLSGIAYSMLMDIWTVLWYNGTWSLSLYAAAFVTALPHTVLYAISNLLFLWFFHKPFGDKLRRLQIKYGI